MSWPNRLACFTRKELLSHLIYTVTQPAAHTFAREMLHASESQQNSAKRRSYFQTANATSDQLLVAQPKRSFKQGQGNSIQRGSRLHSCSPNPIFVNDEITRLAIPCSVRWLPAGPLLRGKCQRDSCCLCVRLILWYTPTRARLCWNCARASWDEINRQAARNCLCTFQWINPAAPVSHLS